MESIKAMQQAVLLGAYITALLVFFIGVKPKWNEWVRIVCAMFFGGIMFFALMATFMPDS